MMDTMAEVLRRHVDVLDVGFSGVRCADGWSSLIDETLAELKRRCPGAKITSMKEKLGLLRIYTANLHDEEAKIVLRHAEGRSASVCERCGEPGGLVAGDGWVGTRCPDHDDG